MTPAVRHDLDYAMKLLIAAKPDCSDLLWRHYVNRISVQVRATGLARSIWPGDRELGPTFEACPDQGPHAQDHNGLTFLIGKQFVSLDERGALALLPQAIMS